MKRLAVTGLVGLAAVAAVPAEAGHMEPGRQHAVAECNYESNRYEQSRTLCVRRFNVPRRGEMWLRFDQRSKNADSAFVRVWRIRRDGTRGARVLRVHDSDSCAGGSREYPRFSVSATTCNNPGRVILDSELPHRSRWLVRASWTYREECLSKYGPCEGEEEYDDYWGDP